MKLLIVGMNPGAPNKNPNKSHTRDRLEKWMDTLEVRHYSFCNTFDEVGSPDVSKIDFDRLNQMCLGYNRIIALGNFASNALKSISVSHFKMPHPSPRNRLLNDTLFEANILNECRNYLND